MQMLLQHVIQLVWGTGSGLEFGIGTHPSVNESGSHQLGAEPGLLFRQVLELGYSSSAVADRCTRQSSMSVGLTGSVHGRGPDTRPEVPCSMKRFAHLFRTTAI